MSTFVDWHWHFIDTWRTLKTEATVGRSKCHIGLKSSVEMNICVGMINQTVISVYPNSLKTMIPPYQFRLCSLCIVIIMVG